MTAAQHAMVEGDYKLAARRLIYARDAEPTNISVLRLLTLAFWQAGDLPAAGRAVRDWVRQDPTRPAAAPLRRAHLRGHAARSTWRPRRPLRSAQLGAERRGRVGARRPAAAAR